jgi:hypothetical protein
MSIFDTLSRVGRREAPLNVVEDAHRPNVAASRALALNEWASTDQCKLIFLPYLDSLIALADAEESTNLLSHAAMANSRGKREALIALRNDFDFWTDKA